ncbi:MAG: type II toxin-antitoxin system prevent-host-death family antitoxin, partial [Acidobacteriota bacterium]
MLTTTAGTPSPEILFIGPESAKAIVRPLEKAGYSVVSMPPTAEVLKESSLAHRWRAIVVHAGSPGVFLEALGNKRLGAPVLLVSPEWPCRRSPSADWGCIQEPEEGERLVREVASFLSEHPADPNAGFPSWVSQVLPATRAKGSFAKLLQDVEKGDRVVVTKHESPSAVVVSYDEFKALRARSESALEAMRSRFADLVAEFQTQAFEQGVDGLFESSPRELGEAAVRAAR